MADNYECKIISLPELAGICRDLRKRGRKIALCHGCFDLLHIGHLYHFKAAKNQADVLVVTVTPDEYVRKGTDRPVFNERMRMEFIAALEIVDYVALNSWESAVKSINLLKPDFFFKGADYMLRTENCNPNIYLEEQAIIAVGGEMRYTDEISFSSTHIIDKYFKNAGKDYVER